MAQPSNSLSTYSAKGNFEDLADVIYDVSKSETPFMSAIPKTKANGTKHEVQYDELDTATGGNAVIDGDDATTDTSNITTRIFNYTQISDKVVRITGSQEAVSSAGRASEMAYQMEMKMPALKRDVETTLLQNVAYVSGNDTTARKTASAQTWILTNTDIAADASAATGDGSDVHTDGTARALTETMFETVLGNAWDSGGNPTLGIMGKNQKKQIAGFSGNATRTHTGESKKITNTIDVYIDPLGNEIRLVPSRQCPADVVYFFDTEQVAFSVLRDFRSYDLAKTGDTDRKQMLVEYALEMRDQRGHGGIYDLS